MSPSIDKIQPADQSQARVEKAALAVAALARVPGLPPVGSWRISARDPRVSGALDVSGSDRVSALAANAAKHTAVSVWATRFGVGLVTRPVSVGNVLVEVAAEFEFEGVPFAVCVHVMPVGIGAAS